MNLAFTRHLLGSSTERVAVGEAVRLAKNELIQTGSDQTANKLQYTLLGDPALRLTIPTVPVVIDSINHQKLVSLSEPLKIGAGSTVHVAGHIDNGAGEVDEAFNGEMTAIVRDAAEEVVCRLNDPSEAETAFTYTDRNKTLFQGSDNVSQGKRQHSPIPIATKRFSKAATMSVRANSPSRLSYPVISAMPALPDSSTSMPSTRQRM